MVSMEQRNDYEGFLVKETKSDSGYLIGTLSESKSRQVDRDH